MSVMQERVAEAICSAFYQMTQSLDIELLGERDEEDGYTTYWHFGHKPKDMRVAVIRDKDNDTVRVRLDWRNLSGPEPLRASQTLVISSYMATQAQMDGPTTDAVVRCLEVFKDVLGGTGVAGPIEKLAPVNEDLDTSTDETDFS